MSSRAPAVAYRLVDLDPTVTTRHNAPARVTPLIGRTDELVELESLLVDERVVTLTGSGGCGKTRLALELVARAGDRFEGGITWVQLASCSDVDGVVAVLAAALDVVERPEEVVLDCVVRVVRARERTMVVLDNAEHVLDAVGHVVAALSSAAEHVTVLCTSREPVGVPGEIVWRVPSLGAPPFAEIEHSSVATIGDFDAVRLFEDRARRARRGFELTDENAAAVAQICSRLDGVPLAIELAAARVRTMPPGRIASLLDDRFRLLAGGSRTLLPRHQTLYASVAWSEGLLDEIEQRVFRRLGVFASGFTIDAAEGVVGAFDDIDRYDVTEVVGRLVDKSLVQFHEGVDRYSLLDTIRSYALQRLLDTAETARARDAHALWFAAWLRRSIPSDDETDVNGWWSSRLATVERVDREWPNCAAAIDWVVPGSEISLRLVAGLGDYWALRQRASDSARYGMPAVVAGDRGDPGWMDAVLALQTVRTNAADVSFASIREDALRIASERGDRRATIRLELAHHVLMVLLVGPRRDLMETLDAITAEAVELREWYTAWNGAQAPAVVLTAVGRPDEAEARIAGLTNARGLLIRASAAQLRGEMATSDALAGEASAMVDLRFGSAMDRMLIAFRAAGAALATTDRSIIDGVRMSDVRNESLPRSFASADALAHGVDELLNGRLEQARAAFGLNQPDLFTSWRSVCHLAQIELALGDPDAARVSATRLRDVCVGVSAPLYEANADLVLAECERAADVNAALDLAHRSLAVSAAASLWPTVVDALEMIGSTLLDMGRGRDAARLLGAAQAARSSMPYLHRFAHRAGYVAAAHRVVIGAEGWAEGTALELPAAVELATRMRGGRVRPTIGWDSLTPTEHRVVEQVLGGLSNPQIATALLMSRATVKTHLVHVFAKLGCSNRAELAVIAARRGAS